MMCRRFPAKFIAGRAGFGQLGLDDEVHIIGNVIAPTHLVQTKVAAFERSGRGKSDHVARCAERRLTTGDKSGV